MFHPCRRLLAATIAISSTGVGLAQPVENRLNLSIALSSDYMHNGLSQSGSDPAVRLAADFEHRLGFFAGGFIANVEYAAEYQYRTPRDLQAGVYGGYLWRIADWTANIAVSRYLYPDINVDYDYGQVVVNASYRDRYFFGAGYADDLLSLDRSAYHYRAGVVFPWIEEIEIGVNAGRFRSSGPPDIAYGFWDVGLSRRLGRFALDLRYHDSSYDAATLLGEGHDRWVISVAYAITPRSRP